MLADLSGKTAIITGGGQGLGFGISTKMAQQGANLIITDIDDRNKSAISDLASKYDIKYLYIEMNVTDQSQVENGINEETIQERNDQYNRLKDTMFDEFSKYYEEGTLKVKVKYSNDKKNGEEVFFDKEGNVKNITSWRPFKKTTPNSSVTKENNLR